MKSKRHNIGHYLWVVLKRVLVLIIVWPLSWYLMAIGWSLARPILAPIITTEAETWFNRVFSELPLVSTIVTFITTKAGRLYIEGSAWWAMAVGIPLMLIGLSQGLIHFFNLVHSITIPRYNRSHCSICNPSNANDL